MTLRIPTALGGLRQIEVNGEVHRVLLDGRFVTAPVMEACVGERGWVRLPAIGAPYRELRGRVEVLNTETGAVMR